MESLKKDSLFIWNDRKWKLIEHDAEYDDTNYFVIRKLFVRWQHFVSQSIICEYLI